MLTLPGQSLEDTPGCLRWLPEVQRPLAGCVMIRQILQRVVR